MASTLTPAEFSTQYLVDIPEIDEQHETLFEILGKIPTVAPDLYKPLDDEQIDDFIDIIDELREYAMLHFRTEESCMQEIDYPELAAQKHEHSRFIDAVTRMEAELMNGSSIPPVKIHNFIHDWCRDHIITLDKPFGDFYKKNSK